MALEQQTWVTARTLTCQYCHDPSTSPTPKGVAAPTQRWELGPLQAPYPAPVGYLRTLETGEAEPVAQGPTGLEYMLEQLPVCLAATVGLEAWGYGV